MGVMAGAAKGQRLAKNAARMANGFIGISVIRVIGPKAPQVPRGEASTVIPAQDAPKPAHKSAPASRMGTPGNSWIMICKNAIALHNCRGWPADPQRADGGPS